MPNEDQIDRAWMLAREVAHLAYIYQKSADPNEKERDPDIGRTLTEIAEALSKRQKRWEKSLGPIHHVSSVERLTKVLKEYRDDGVTERAAKIEVWRILTCFDDPDYHDEELALHYQLPSKDQIAKTGGPKEAAIAIWEDLHQISRRTIYSHQKNQRSGKLKFSLRGRFLPFLNRMDYSGEIVARVLGLKKVEMKQLGEALVELAEDPTYLD
jgi:hypothetical protein